MNIWNKILSRIDHKLRSLGPKRIAARFTGQIIVANSIPKAGTHLLSRCLMLFPSLSYSGLHYTRGNPNCTIIEKYLRRTGKGRFMAAHIWWDENCANLFQERSVISILLLRDPRDLMISFIFHVLKRETHRWHYYFKKLPNMDARIRTCILGINNANKNKFNNVAIADRFRKFTPWIHFGYSLPVYFENLVGPKGGGNTEKQRNQIINIATHLGQHLDERKIFYISERLFYNKSVTFRKGLIGEWRKYFTDELKDLFKEVNTDLLQKYGYEKDNDW